MTKTCLLTRGNSDGIISAAMALRADPDIKTIFVSHAQLAVQWLRRDLDATDITVCDLGLNDALAAELSRRAKTGSRVVYLDHHATSPRYVPRLSPRVDARIENDVSAAHLAWIHYGKPFDLELLAGLTDFIEGAISDVMLDTWDRLGPEQADLNAQALDWCWRLNVNDDAFRRLAAESLSTGRLPMECDSIRTRYEALVSSGRWNLAVERASERLRLNGGLAILEGQCGLYGFGSRALSEAARRAGASACVRAQHQGDQTHLSLRRTSSHATDLGLFVQDFTQEHGYEGGGHAAAAGGHIPRRRWGVFNRELSDLVPAAAF